jgi:two-component system sensor histidine kinase UhpB
MTWHRRRPKQTKVFWFFFSKKNNFLSSYLCSMSLRFRLLAAIFAALLVSFAAGAGLAAWHAAATVHDELAASLASARDGTLAGLAGVPPGQAGMAQLRRMVAAFDGNRHVRAELLDPGGEVLAASVPGMGAAAPGWFRHLVAPNLKPVLARVGSAAVFRLVADAHSEAGERWTELSERMASLGVFFVVAAVLCSVTVGRSLRPLTALAAGFARVGRGELQAELVEAGPPEIATLAGAFNRMAAELRAAEAQNRRLSQQVMTIAEEERAEIARDLHDDIGPLLFATTAFAASIGRMVETGDVASVPAQLRAIQESVAQVQREVRDMLGRLHEAAAAPADLHAALEELFGFWRGVRPNVAFSADVALAAARLNDAARECLFRAAQEGISNAVRHAQPSHVWVRAWVRDGMAVLSVRDDGMPLAAGSGQGLGLAGMRARAAALGGRVDIVRDAGWEVIVSLPLESAG